MTGGMMFKGTPGPWRAVKAFHGPIDILDERDRDIVTVYGGGVETESKSANANLIAAAPELLEVVMRLANGERSDEGHTAIRDAAIAAIDKALGEQK